MAERTIDVCFSPALLHLPELTGRIVVVIDILRATSTICTALHHGAARVIPVASVEEALHLRENGCVAGAERNGKKVDGFELGNSPFEYMKGAVSGKTVVLTTTNGTRAIEMARTADHIVIGSFLNRDALCAWLKNRSQDILLLCAGWKNRFNLEDSLFAGAVIHQLRHLVSPSSDAALASMMLYEKASSHLLETLRHSSHFQRLARLGVEKDIRYCLTLNVTDTVPVWTKEGIVAP